jgi:hypothetical protein
VRPAKDDQQHLKRIGGGSKIQTQSLLSPTFDHLMPLMQRNEQHHYPESTGLLSPTER